MGELVELDVTTLEESVTVNVTEEGAVQINVVAEKGDTGPAGPAGPNSVTSATTSDATCELSLESLQVGQNSVVTGSAAAAIGECTASSSYDFAAGYQNTASGGASIALGSGSTASGVVSFANGGACVASADFSHAAGFRAKAIHNGASVESDSQDADVESLTTDEKTFRFQNGYRFLGGSATFDGTLFANHIHGNIAGSVYAHVRAGENLAKGDPVYISGSHGSGASLIAIVSKADASNAAKMPAVGIMDAAVSANANGHMVITGTISELDTNAYAVNSVLYVASGGGFTATPPAANSQPVAIVERSNTNNGAIIVKVNGATVNATNVAAVITSATEDTAPLDADLLPMTDSSSDNALRRLTFANLWTWIRGKLDGVLTIAGAKTLTGQLELTGQAATSDTSAMTRFLSSYEQIISGNEFCQLVATTSQQAGSGSSGGVNLVFGMQATVTNTLSGSASAYTGESVLSHQSFSGASARTGVLMDLFFHGVMLRIEQNTNWVLRINFGVGTPSRVPPAAGVVVATARQWGVEFYYDGVNYVGRMYWYDTSINYGTPFILPTITASNWPNLVYSIRMRQTSTGLLEFYINTPTASLGGGRLSDTPTASMQATWTSSTYAGRYINFEAANGTASAATTGVRIQCSTIYGRLKA